MNRIDLNAIAREVKARGYFPSFERYRYAFAPDDVQRVLLAIGQSRTPRFVLDEDNRFAYGQFARFLHGDRSFCALDPYTGKTKPGNLSRGIFLAGSTGTGKSWCLEIMNAYASLCGFRIRFSNERDPKPFTIALVRADEITAEFARSGSIERFRNMRVLGIQDLGQEPEETLYMGNRLNVLAQLIEFRGDRSDYLTFFTSNLRLNGEKMQARYGDRVVSRLSEMCNYLEIRGKDRRTTL